MKYSPKHGQEINTYRRSMQKRETRFSKYESRRLCFRKRGIGALLDETVKAEAFYQSRERSQRWQQGLPDQIMERSLYKVHFSSGAVLPTIADSMTAANISATNQAQYIERIAKRDIGHAVRVELDLDGKEIK